VGRAVALLTEEREVALVGLPPHLDQQRPGTTGGVADRISLLWREQAGQQRRDLPGRIELARLLAGVRGEAFQEILVDVADHVLVADRRGPQVEALVVEVFEQMFETGVPFLGLPQFGLRVEADLAEDTFQLLLVRLLDLAERHVDPLADVRLGPASVEAGEVAPLGKLEALARQAAVHAQHVAPVLLQVLVAVVAPHI